MAGKGKKLRPAVVLITLPIALFLVFIVLFIDTCTDYSRIQGYRDELSRDPYAHNNLNRYKRMLAVKQQKLDALKRGVRIRFRPSSFKKRVEAMARLSSIPVNNLSIERFTIQKGSGYQRLLIELKVKTAFSALGAFLSRLETATVQERDRFAYVLRVSRVDIAVIKLHERTLSARLHLIVFRKAGM